MWICIGHENTFLISDIYCKHTWRYWQKNSRRNSSGCCLSMHKHCATGSSPRSPVSLSVLWHLIRPVQMTALRRHELVRTAAQRTLITQAKYCRWRHQVRCWHSDHHKPLSLLSALSICVESLLTVIKGLRRQHKLINRTLAQPRGPYHKSDLPSGQKVLFAHGIEFLKNQLASLTGYSVIFLNAMHRYESALGTSWLGLNVHLERMCREVTEFVHTLNFSHSLLRNAKTCYKLAFILWFYKF